MGLGLEIALLIFLVVLNAAFAGAEIALVSLRETQISRLEESGPRSGGGSARSRPEPLPLDHPGRHHPRGFLASAVAAVSLAEPLVEPLDFLGDAAEPVAVVLVTIVLSFFTLVSASSLRSGSPSSAERWALVAARPLGWLSRVLRPAVWVLGRATDLTVRLLGGDPEADRGGAEREEVREIVSRHPDLPPKQRAVLDGAFEVADRTLGSVMIPRTSVLSLDADDLAPAAAETLIRGGHSRAPVHQGSLDDVAGVVHLRDLLGSSAPVGEHVREPVFLPESAPVLDTLGLLQRKRRQWRS